MQSEIIQLPKIVFKKETVYDTKTIVKPTLTMEVCFARSKSTKNGQFEQQPMQHLADGNVMQNNYSN